MKALPSSSWNSFPSWPDQVIKVLIRETDFSAFSPLEESLRHNLQRETSPMRPRDVSWSQTIESTTECGFVQDRYFTSHNYFHFTYRIVESSIVERMNTRLPSISDSTVSDPNSDWVLSTSTLRTGDCFCYRQAIQFRPKSWKPNWEVALRSAENLKRTDLTGHCTVVSQAECFA